MKKLKQKLEESGFKLTKPRLAVLEILEKNHTPLSAQEMHAKIKKADLASVYRTLNLFEELAIVNAEIIQKEKKYCLADVPHHHIICDKCGYLEKIKCDHFFKSFRNFTNIKHRLTLTGVCNACN